MIGWGFDDWVLFAVGLTCLVVLFADFLFRESER